MTTKTKTRTCPVCAKPLPVPTYKFPAKLIQVSSHSEEALVWVDEEGEGATVGETGMDRTEAAFREAAKSAFESALATYRAALSEDARIGLDFHALEYAAVTLAPTLKGEYGGYKGYLWPKPSAAKKALVAWVEQTVSAALASTPSERDVVAEAEAGAFAGDPDDARLLDALVAAYLPGKPELGVKLFALVKAFADVNRGHPVSRQSGLARVFQAHAALLREDA